MEPTAQVATIDVKDATVLNVDDTEAKVEPAGPSQPAAAEIYIPQAEYSSVCNADFLPMICNEFIQEFLDKEHGACSMDRTEAINLTRNFCHWIADNRLTCARIQLYS